MKTLCLAGAGALARSLFLLGGQPDELHQVALPGRSAELADLFADACGIAVALFLLHGKKPATKGTP